MIIINSASYISDTMVNEFGKIPPAFYPLGNRKLLELQVKYLRNNFNDRIILTLPKDFKLSNTQESILNDLKIYRISLEDSNLSLSKSLLNTCLKFLNLFEDEQVLVIHADSLFKEIPNKNFIGISYNDTDYNFDYLNLLKKDSFNGLFRCDNILDLIQCLNNNDNFFECIKELKSKENLELVNFTDYYDFGHINNYFKNRNLITTERNFNSLVIDNHKITKTSSNLEKINAECNWFKNLPNDLKIYIPQLLDYNNKNYSLEYIYGLPLNELFVNTPKDIVFWDKILNLIKEFLNKANNDYLPVNQKDRIQKDFKKLVKDKTIKRLTQYANSKNIDLNSKCKYGKYDLPSLNEIVEDCVNLTMCQREMNGVLHGDLCFSNIIYDSKSNHIKLIDPRGMNSDNELTIYGDLKYDLAKLCHSFVGYYDYIISDYFIIEENELKFFDDKSDLSKLFLEKEIIEGFDNFKIIPLTVLLFLSMIPLHSDFPKRQEAMLLNALRLYNNYVLG